MQQILYSYFISFLHPFKTQKYLSDLSDNDVETTWRGKIPFLTLNFYEFLGVSWVFVIIKSIYALISLLLEYKAFDFASHSNSLSYLLKPAYYDMAIFQKTFLFIILLKTIFFPLSAWIYVKFWGVMIKFASNLFTPERDEQQLHRATAEITNSSLCSNILLVVPVFGEFLEFLYSLFFIFIGLKENLKFSNLQSVIVLALPIFSVLLTLLVMLLYIFLLI
ncbi:MAG: hypothetical protein ISR65_01250 [Bacteriovoracaceae bacterium]|nr:hypothetical protein [Bacteriovoracaceae bacterium]